MSLCDDTELQELIAMLQSGGGDDLVEVDRLLSRFPDDPRLLFMKGSILAGKKTGRQAHSLMERAVALAPDFHIARYQLGFLEFTSAEANRAFSTWGPLLRLPEDHYLRRFVEGLTHLARDEFADAIADMEVGLSLNQENEPLNNDIRLLLSNCSELEARSARQSRNESSSMISRLLSLFNRRA